MPISFSQLSEKTLEEFTDADRVWLETQLEAYPYFAKAQLLYAKCLFGLGHPRFERQFRKAALYVTDRAVLYDLFGDYFIGALEQKDAKRTKEVSLGSMHFGLSRTASDETPLVESSSQPGIESIKTDQSAAYSVEDLASIPDVSDADEEIVQGLPPYDIIDRFIKSGKTRITPGQRNQDSHIEEDARSSLVESEGPVSETLAKIYLKQDKKDKAIAVYRKLALQFPEKNAYFARQIDLLKKK